MVQSSVVVLLLVGALSSAVPVMARAHPSWYIPPPTRRELEMFRRGHGHNDNTPHAGHHRHTNVKSHEDESDTAEQEGHPRRRFSREDSYGRMYYARGSGLSEPKDIVDSPPKPIKEGLSKKQAAKRPRSFSDITGRAAWEWSPLEEMD